MLNLLHRFKKAIEFIFLIHLILNSYKETPLGIFRAKCENNAVFMVFPYLCVIHTNFLTSFIIFIEKNHISSWDSQRQKTIFEPKHYNTASIRPFKCFSCSSSVGNIIILYFVFWSYENINMSFFLNKEQELRKWSVIESSYCRRPTTFMNRNVFWFFFTWSRNWGLNLNVMSVVVICI